MPVVDHATTSVRPRSMVGVVGESPTMIEAFRMVDRVAPTNCTVLVTGESGTGKELVARAVHQTSQRAAGPFVAINCGAIPGELLESELFGHVRGAFTGACATKPGLLATAEKGTLFLDEIGELPLALQVKLLRVLQTYEYSPIGDTRSHKADVRIVAATNSNLEQAVKDGAFRADLFYRLNVIPIALPPLRERGDDVLLLFREFVAKTSARLERPEPKVSLAALRLLQSYAWPGNVRELEHAVERALLVCQGDTIEPRDLPARLHSPDREVRRVPDLPDAGLDLRAAVEAFENELICKALARTGWNKNEAAMLLGIKRTTLVEMIKRKRIGVRAA